MNEIGVFTKKKTLIMTHLNGIRADIFQNFDDYEHKNLNISFVRSSKTKDKGCIFFGSRMYGLADLYSTNGSINVQFDGQCGVNLESTISASTETVTTANNVLQPLTNSDSVVLTTKQFNQLAVYINQLETRLANIESQLGQ